MEEEGSQASTPDKVDAQIEKQSQSKRAQSPAVVSESRRQHARGQKAKGRELKPKTKDPKGGLTAAGRAELKRKEGANLRPGVKKPQSEMSSSEMRRKGSWAVRFYGRKGKLPPLKKKNGEPTRFALSAAAWGELVPKTQAAARKIAAKGRRLLRRYSKTKS